MPHLKNIDKFTHYMQKFGEVGRLIGSLIHVGAKRIGKKKKEVETVESFVNHCFKGLMDAREFKPEHANNLFVHWRFVELGCNPRITIRSVPPLHPKCVRDGKVAFAEAVKSREAIAIKNGLVNHVQKFNECVFDTSVDLVLTVKWGMRY